MDKDDKKNVRLVSREQVNQYMRTGSSDFENGENEDFKDKEEIKSFGNVPTKIVLDRGISRKIKSVIATVAVAGIIIAPITFVQEMNRAHAEEIVYTAEVPDEFDGDLNYIVEEQRNHEAHYLAPNGKSFYKLEGIPAERMVEITKDLGLGENLDSDSISGIKR